VPPGSGIHMNLLKKVEDRKAAICMIGLGYVGLPTAVFLAQKGFKVIGADIDERKIGKINKRETVLGDANLSAMVKELIDAGKMEATTDIANAVARSDIILVTVPTPVTVAKEPDLGCVISASEAISKGLRRGQLVVLESTTYPGTTEEVMQPILERTGLKAGKDFGLAYCPERYNPGDKEHTLEKVNRVLGGITPEWAEITRALYSTIIEGEVRVLRNIRTAEAAKIVENIQRDLNIAIVNEFALIFDRLGVDVVEVLDGASTKWNFLKFKPGPGVGGHCLPVDPYYLTYKARELGYHPQLILAGRSINNHMPHYVVKLAVDGLNSAGKAVSKSKIAIIGVAYKSNTSDLRESPSISIVKELAGMKGKVRIHDPLVDAYDCERHLKMKKSGIAEALDGADCVILLNSHDAMIKKLSLSYIKSMVKPGCVLVDTQYIFEPDDVRKCGLIYKGIGRGAR
jgi:nucleotide sugar dehydrogenase